MFCTQCGQALGEADAFCTNCGRQRYVGALGAPRAIPQTQIVAGRQEGSDPIPRILFLVLGIAQIAGALVFALYWFWVFGFEFDAIYQLQLSVLLEAAVVAAPMVAAGLSDRWSRDGRVLGAVATVGLVRFIATIKSLFEDDYFGDFKVWILRLSILLLVSAIAGPILVLIKLRPTAAFLDFRQDWWRAPLGVAAVLFLILENPGRVLPESWPVLTWTLFPVMALAAFLLPFLRQGVYAGLAIAVVSSIVATAWVWVTNWDIHDYQSFVSIPSVLALMCCIGAVLPVVALKPSAQTVPSK